MFVCLCDRHRKRYKEFQFWLFSDQLIYGERTPLGSYTLNRQIFLTRCYIDALSADDPEAIDSFVVMSPAKTFKVKAKNSAEKKEWIDAITTQMNKLRDEKVAKAGGDESIAPLWKPDSNCPECELCAASFTLIFRRHHCRNCGMIVCDNCSAKRFKLPHVDNRRLVRVCDVCYPTLSGSTGAGGSSSSAKRPTMISQDSLLLKSDRVSMDEDTDDDDDDDPYMSMRVRRGDVDEHDFEDFNEWEREGRRTGFLPEPTEGRSENERIAMLVTAPMMKISAALGENFRRFARNSITTAFGTGSAGSSPSMLSPASRQSSANATSFPNPAVSLGENNRQRNVLFSASNDGNDSLSPKDSARSPAGHFKPPPPPPPPPLSPVSPSLSSSPTPRPPPPPALPPSPSLGGNLTPPRSTSPPPPKPVRAQRRTNVVLQIDPVILAAQVSAANSQVRSDEG